MKNVQYIILSALMGLFTVLIIGEFTKAVHSEDPRTKSSNPVRKMTFGQAVGKFAHDHFGHKPDTWTPSIPSNP